MSDGFLSQEEIDALLRGEPAETPAAPVQQVLSDMETDALGEIGNISMGSAATTLSILLGKRVSITTPRVSPITMEEIRQQMPLPYLMVEVGYTEGIRGTNLLAIRQSDALVIADLMMGGDGSNPPEFLNELYMSAVGEAMNQMMGAVATSMSTVFKKRIDIAPPQVRMVDLAKDQEITDAFTEQESILRVAFRMEVEDLIDSEIMQILPVPIAKDMVTNLMNSMQPAPTPAPAAVPAPTPAPQAAPVPQPQAAPAPQPTPMAAMPPQYPPPEQPMYYMPPPGYPMPGMAYAQAPQAMPANVHVQPAQFAPLTTGMPHISEANIGLLMDVPLQITVELGRTRKLIREILELAPGSVVELDKLAGESVDVLVNGKLIAKGEVVVIDENFGVRITDIISPLERAANLQ